MRSLEQGRRSPNPQSAPIPMSSRRDASASGIRARQRSSPPPLSMRPVTPAHRARVRYAGAGVLPCAHPSHASHPRPRPPLRPPSRLTSMSIAASAQWRPAGRTTPGDPPQPCGNGGTICLPCPSAGAAPQQSAPLPRPAHPSPARSSAIFCGGKASCPCL